MIDVHWRFKKMLNDSVTCANRLKLIVLLRRFYAIDRARRPNPASRCLALSPRTPGGEFEVVHGL